MTKMSRGNEEKIFVNNYIPLPPDDFHTKSKLQDVLSRPSQYLANVEIKNFDTILSWFTPDFLITFACRAERDYLFFEKGFDRELFLKKKHKFSYLPWIKNIIIEDFDHWRYKT